MTTLHSSTRAPTAIRRTSLFKRALLGLVAVGCLGLLGFGALAWRPAIAPIPPPAPDSFAPELVAKGETLAGGGYCAECHTAKGGQKFAGGYPMATPFGVLYSTNITPDRETGIGTWSEAAFARAMREGIARDGSHLLPGFPYDHYSKLSDDDVKALYAYFMTRIRSKPRHRQIQFPFRSTSAPCRKAGRFCSFDPDASKRSPAGAPNGTAAPISPWGWAIAVPATRRATCSARKRRAKPMPAR